MFHEGMPEAKTYTGGCHCGRVRYEVTTDLAHVTTCNCSICTRKGPLLSFVPASQFKALSGEDSLTDYQFNKMNIHHLFCKVCGVESYATGTGKDGSKMFAINIRCLDDIDIWNLPTEPTRFDGKSR